MKKKKNNSKRTVFGRIGAAAAALAVALGISLTGGTAAYAGSATCGNLIVPLCGQIALDSGLSQSLMVGQNWTLTAHTTTDPSKVTGLKKFVGPGASTTQYRASNGDYIDWDALMIPSGKCVKFKYGAGHTQTATYNRIGKATLWVKVDGWGARVTTIKSAAC